MAEAPPRGLRGRRTILARVAQRCLDELQVDFTTIAMATSPDAWTPAYATSPAVEHLEQFAFTVGEGPCLDALRGHVTVVMPDLSDAAAAARWPAWTGEARRLGIGSVAAFPIQAGAIAAGALTTYSRGRGVFDPARTAAALRLADAALLGLLDLMAGLETSAPDDKDGAVLLRAEVHQAAGMIMVQAQVPIDQALARLRAYSFASGRELADVANDVVHRRLRFESDRAGAE